MNGFSVCALLAALVGAASAVPQFPPNPHQPVSPSNAGCALIVSGPPRSANFDRANRAFGGANPPYSPGEAST